MIRDLIAAAAIAAIGCGVACSSSERFTCQSDLQCVTDVLRGQCEPEGVCSFPDLGCPSGQRYGEFSGEFARECVPLPGGTGTTTEMGEGGSSTAGRSTGGTTNEAASTTEVGSGFSTSGKSTGTEAGSGGTGG